ncbi:MAG TPA: serine acetyltransferase [Firmicutes bacterium]|nr:serine acetyltransferase [Bacillota bacterium]
MIERRQKPEDLCAVDVEVLAGYRCRLPQIAQKIIESCSNNDGFNHVDYEPIPSKEAVIKIIDKFLEIIFPGYFGPEKLDPINLNFSIGQCVTQLFDMLAEQVNSSIRHDCNRYNLSCQECNDKGFEISLKVLDKLPEIRRVLAADVRATLEGDPAARSYDEIIFSYPGIFAITVYRVAHTLHKLGVPLLPRIMTEYAHSKTGIDIHPGADIGESFAIDHGTGVVIGETAQIGKNVRIYQGVTLGALSLTKEECAQLRDRKRHPTIEDDVIIYAGATILGGNTVIGARSVIGGNIWITESVPSDTKVLMEKPKLIYHNGIQ